MFYDLAPADAPRPRPYPNPINMRQYVNDRALTFGFTGEIIRGASRLSEHVEARYAIATELRGFGYSYPAIGRAINRDHSSVLWMIRGGRRKDPRRTAELKAARKAAA